MGEKMTHKEFKRKRRTLTEIVAEEPVGKQSEELQRLVKEVGVSITRTSKIQIGHYASNVYYKTSNEITEPEVVNNIQEIPKTEKSIDMCKPSARNYKVDLISTTIALLTMLASWALVLVMLRSSE
jgi:hypothetical protein